MLYSAHNGIITIIDQFISNTTIMIIILCVYVLIMLLLFVLQTWPSDETQTLS